jgi:anti-sigma regulatory factor (Ser/Thr protein kinase)
VTFIDVLRAAVAEVEDYARIRVEVRSKAALAGQAVADVVHLLAELMENAAVFSPPSTVVRVQGELVGRGFAVEIEDRGLGIAPERMEEFNRDLAGLPAFDPAGSDRLGLFITGRLAHRHGIKVTLRSSVYGGTSAVVIIPSSLVVTGGSQIPAREAGGRVLEPVAAAAALSSVNGHSSNGHAGNGSASDGFAGNGHAGNGQAGNGFAGNGFTGNGHAGNGEGATPDSRMPRHAAPPRTASMWQPDDSQPIQVTPPPAPGESGRWTLRTMASRRAADSVQAGQVIAGATELVPGPDRGTGPAGEQSGELPVRVRQESLAPQLRDPDATDTGAFPALPGSAEELRNTMSTMQRGWERARSAPADPPASADPGPAAAEQNRSDQDGE